MSYITGPAPDDTKLEIIDNQLVLSFTCPRCDEKSEQVIDPDYLLHEVFISCDHSEQTEPGVQWRYLVDNPFAF